MGYTSRFLRAGGVDAVESEFGPGRTSAFVARLLYGEPMAAPWPGIPYIPQHRVQDLRFDIRSTGSPTISGHAGYASICAEFALEWYSDEWKNRR